MRRKLRRTDGFSLLELLTVVAIIAILVAISIPSYRLQQSRAKRIEGLQFLSVIQIHALASYVATDKYPMTFLEVGLTNDYVKLKYYKVPASGYPCDLDGPQFVATQICVYQTNGIESGFACLLVGNIDQRNDGVSWEEDVLVVAAGTGMPAVIKVIGVPFVYHDDLAY